MARRLRVDAMLLCDAVETDDSGKESIVGLLDIVTTPGFPCVLGPVTIFLQLAGGMGEYVLSASIYDVAKDRSESLDGDVRIQVDDPLQMRRVGFVLPEFAVGHSGEFDVIAWSNGEELARQRFRVRVAQ